MSVSSPPDRWIPFQCPSCHGVFRLRKSNVGRTGRCPMCGAAVETVARSIVHEKITEQRESKSDLLKSVAVAQEMTKEEIVAQEAAMKNRRRVYHGQGEDTASGVDWDDYQRGRVQSQSSWKIWVSGFLAIVLIGACGAYYLATQKSPDQLGATDLAAKKMLEGYLETEAPVVPQDEEEVTNLVDRYELFDIKEIEKAVKGFLNAESVEAKKVFVRQPERVAALMDHHYSRGEYVPEKFESLEGSRVSYYDNLALLTVQTGDFLNNGMTVERVEKDGKVEYRVDWESWVGYSEMTPEEMRSKKPIEPFLIRATVGKGDYYNFGFSDDKVWSSYRIKLGDDGYEFLGYVRRGSELDKKLLPIRQQDLEGKIIIKVAYPPQARAKDQVEIVEIVSEKSWVIYQLADKNDE